MEEGKYDRNNDKVDEFLRSWVGAAAVMVVLGASYFLGSIGKRDYNKPEAEYGGSLNLSKEKDQSKRFYRSDITDTLKK